MLVSVVIPCYKNEAQLENTVAGIISAINPVTVDFEIILVDDASTDNTWIKIKSLSKIHKEVKGIRLRENVGAYYAITYGFDESTGDLVLVMAADGDDPPNLIPEFFKNVDENTQAVLATREISSRSFGQRIQSGVFLTTLKILGGSNLQPGGSDFMLFQKAVLTKTQSIGWKSGNTLIQLIQNAESIKTFEYVKGTSESSSWTVMRKLKLFIQTVNQFASLPRVASVRTRMTITERC